MGKHHNKMCSNYVRLCVVEAAQTPANNAGMPAVDRYSPFLYRLPQPLPPGMRRCFRQPQPSDLPRPAPTERFYVRPERPEVTRPSSANDDGDSRGLDWILRNNNMTNVRDPML